MTSIMTSIFLGFSARTSTSSTANQDGARGRMTPFNPESESPVPQLADAQRVSNETSSGWELEWVRRVASGDRSAFERLYNGYQRRLFGYLYRMVGKADAAEELTNDVMLEVWKGAAGFRGDSKVSTWIFGIARFRALSRLRRTDRETVDIEDAGPLRDPYELEDEVVVKESTRKEVQAAILKLSREHREVIELTFYQGFSYPEIEEILHCPVNTVKTRMFYARKELRELLHDAGEL